MYRIKISEYATVEDLKRQISTRTKVPVTHQILTGWKNANVMY